ncbi:hypothetical protein LQX23_003070 [Vibrio parahaemolyticus]|nr:hypothetical protein [Vibrio parahaemolyticus]ELA7517416.1 hypothetical protein [Vibrio parahaemolyticus]
MVFCLIEYAGSSTLNQHALFICQFFLELRTQYPEDTLTPPTKHSVLLLCDSAAEYSKANFAPFTTLIKAKCGSR